MENLFYSSNSNPCPICGRTKDGDCRISKGGDLVLCHHNFGDTCPDGWRYVKPSADDRTGTFVRDYPKTDRPWGQTFYHQYRSFQGTTHTQVRKYVTKSEYEGSGRKETKKCRWQTALGSIKEIDLCPYRWEEVKDAPEIFIAEGELCVDDLHSRGLPATSVRSWSEKQAELFRDKTVILVPDCDQEGIKRLNKTAEILTRSGATVKYCYLPRIGNWEYPSGGLDSYDYFGRGGTIDELRESVTDTPLEINEPAPSKSQGADQQSAKVFDLLMAITQDCYLFKQDNQFGDTFADVTVDGIRSTYKLRTLAFKTWLISQLFTRHGKPANSEALESCLKVCEGLSMQNIGQIWFKTAEHAGCTYLDLCNDQWQAIEISKGGWRLVDSIDLPIRFMRSPAQLPLPLPVNSATGISKLWKLLPIAEQSKPLVLGWLLSCLVPTGDKPILVLSAPKGSGKSTIARYLVNLIDCTKSALLPAVGDRRALAVQSRHRWIFAYDNLSHLTADQQDALCCASTGAGYMERKLFTDDEVCFVEYHRPQILTSVDLVPTRSDLLDRCLLVKVKPIAEADRLTNEKLDRLFTESHPEILGALLNFLVVALNNLDKVTQPLQRMSSFHKLGISARIPNFHETYLTSISNAQQEAVKANPIADAIAELSSFDGSATALVEALKKVSDDPKVQKLSSRGLGRMLNGTLKSDLNAIGINVDSYRNKQGVFWIIQTDNATKITTLTTLSPHPPWREDSSDVVCISLTTPTTPITTPNPPVDVVISSCSSVKKKSVLK